jgi:ubiquinone/menaquinone biosynthesis C-methylase UbiE
MEFEERMVIDKAEEHSEREHIDRYKFACQFVEGKTVLDIASGSGYGSHLLSQHAERVFGVDVSPEAVRYASERFACENMTYTCASGTDIKFIASESIDIIISFETIEHISNYMGFLDELFRVLKSDGRLFISTPNKKYSSIFRKKPLNQYHVIEFYPSEFNRILSSRFAVLKAYGQNPLTPIKEMIRIVNQFIPLWIKNLLIPDKARRGYRDQEVTGIVETNISKCLYVLAFCAKKPQ